MAITDRDGAGLLFIGQPVLSVSAHHNTMEDFESSDQTARQVGSKVRPVNRHTVDVKPRDLTSVNIDYKQMGVGGDDSWGAWTHPQYRLMERSYRYSFIIRPLEMGDNIEEKAVLVYRGE
jgi:beta-galactosidase